MREVAAVGIRRRRAVKEICPYRTDKVEKIGDRRDAVGCTWVETSLDERRNVNLVARVAGV